MSRHNLAAQTSNICITQRAPLNAIAYIVCVKQFVMSLPAISLGDRFSVNKGEERGFCMHIANDTYHVHTYKRTNIPTPPAQCLGTAVPRQNPCKALSRDGMSKVTDNSHTYNRLVRYKFSNGNPILPPSVTVPTALVPTSTPHQCLQSFLMSQNRHVHMSCWMITACSGHFPISSMAVTNITFKSEACCTRDDHSHTHCSNS